MQYKEVAGGICAPKGFAAAGVHCGIRANHNEKYDLALIIGINSPDRISRGLRFIRSDSDFLAYDRIQQRRLAYIGTSYNPYKT